MKKFFLYVLLTVAVISFIGMHFRMDHKVGHLEGQFVSIVEDASDASMFSKTAPSFWDRYQGRLDALVATRDSIAHADGYRVLGGWISKNYRAETFCVYVYTFGL